MEKKYIEMTLLLLNTITNHAFGIDARWEHKANKFCIFPAIGDTKKMAGLIEKLTQPSKPGANDNICGQVQIKIGQTENFFMIPDDQINLPLVMRTLEGEGKNNKTSENKSHVRSSLPQSYFDAAKKVMMIFAGAKPLTQIICELGGEGKTYGMNVFQKKIIKQVKDESAKEATQAGFSPCTQNIHAIKYPFGKFEGKDMAIITRIMRLAAADALGLSADGIDFMTLTLGFSKSKEDHYLMAGGKDNKTLVRALPVREIATKIDGLRQEIFGKAGKLPESLWNEQDIDGVGRGYLIELPEKEGNLRQRLIAGLILHMAERNGVGIVDEVTFKSALHGKDRELLFFDSEVVDHMVNVEVKKGINPRLN